MILSLQPPEENGELGENGEEEPEIAIRIGLRTPQPWISMGSEFEVEDERVVQTDERVCVFVNSFMICTTGESSKNFQIFENFRKTLQWCIS